MADQNQQVNQNVNNQNENDELFWWSDDIFENSDLLQPINSEIDSAHHVVKSQNDLNNFSGELQANSKDNISDNFEKKWEQQDNPNQPEIVENDDLFEQSQPEQNYDDHFENLYDDNWDKDDKWNTDDLWTNDDIFDSPDGKENTQEEPEIVDHIDEEVESEQDEQLEQQPEKVEEQTKEEEYPVEDIPEKKDEENKKEENIVENGEEEDDDDDFDDIDDIDDIDEDDDENDDENYEDEDEVDDKEIDEINDSNDSWETDEEEVKVKPKDDDEEDEKENNTPRETKDEDEEESDEYFDDFWDEEDQEEMPKTDEEEKENITIQDYEKYDPNLFKTDVQKKFWELQRKTEQIHKLVWKDLDVGFDLLWWNDDRQKTIYKIISWEDYVEIEKEELNKEDESTKTNLLWFVLDWNNLEIYVNDVLLYNEIPDLQNDPNKKMQVLEKMNKFIFLLDEEYKKIQKYKKEKEERNAVKWVFRNF